ncbi:redoxin domain-containing protein [Aureisphaera galaxeae]|uniref:deiodinase-like protein n=1 Tax=Aureisphaera galaxeae TaxID=1538023 RepID=UPI0023504BCC|nr:deiodinase-like protein [Aureisphaera galaxeae]MDC8002467.1 redoxin domain-containing protein [Aureisphaera galaxeae]
MNPEYEFLVDPGALHSSLTPYAIHFFIAVFQFLVALYGFQASKRYLFKSRSRKMPSQLTDENPFMKYAQPLGLTFLILAFFVITPTLLGWHFVFSAIGMLGLFILWFVIKTPSRKRTILGRIGIPLLIILCMSFMIWEGQDPAQLSTRICFKAWDWRTYERVWQDIHDKRAPKMGEMAPDFELVSTDKQDTLRLSELRNKKPVALIFGSQTCPPHSDGTVRIYDLYKTYKGQVEFVPVYLQEAHPIDKWWLGESKTQQAVFRSSGTLALMQRDEPLTMEEREKVASSYAKDLFKNEIPVYVDAMDNHVGELYAAKPTRIYLLDEEGKVVYNPGFGPVSFNADRLAEQIEALLSK